MELPATAAAVVLHRYDGELALTTESVPVPRPGPGQVLVRMAAAPINPSDLVFLRGLYGVTKNLPIVPGFEGSGTVVDAGPGLLGRWLKGRRVACRAPENGHGTWATYMVCPAANCLPLKASITLDQGASLLVNPATAICLMRLVRKGHYRAFVQTAAASALGRMLVRLSQHLALPAIHIVRRPEQVSILRADGAEHVLDSSQADFADRLSALARHLDARIAFDAVGGVLTGTLAAQLPKGSRIVVYGVLSGEDCVVPAGPLVFGGATVKGFWLTEEFRRMNLLQKLALAREVQGLLTTDLATQVQSRFSLDRVQDAIQQYKKRRSDGKVLLVP